MKRLLLASLLALCALPSPAPAQVGVQIQVGLPVAPPLVVVQPGVQVVENYDEEVFVTGGWYWVRRGPYWYRARGPRAQFVYCEPRYVPARLTRIPPGQYRHWRKHEVKEARREERAQRKAWKQEKEHGHGGGGHEHGHGHGRGD